MLVLLASPHAGGVTDILGAAAARGAGNDCTVISLRDYSIAPCCGCGHCQRTGVCIHNDDAKDVFTLIRRSRMLLIAAPVYFYALPAPFKALIDRSQVFWAQPEQEWALSRAAGVIMAAGRPRGEQLFTGSLLTLKWFLKPFAYHVAHTVLLRSLDSPEDLREQPEYETQARVLGQTLAQHAPTA